MWHSFWDDNVLCIYSHAGIDFLLFWTTNITMLHSMRFTGILSLFQFGKTLLISFLVYSISLKRRRWQPQASHTALCLILTRSVRYLQNIECHLLPISPPNFCLDLGGVTCSCYVLLTGILVGTNFASLVTTFLPTITLVSWLLHWYKGYASWK